MIRKERLLAKLAARTDHEGKPKPGFAENVASIRAELSMIEESIARIQKLEGEDGTSAQNAG